MGNYFLDSSAIIKRYVPEQGQSWIELRLREKALANQAPPPTFVCADNDLITIAAKEGLNVENPNNLLDENPNNHLEA